jgi:hypothetical protein
MTAAPDNEFQKTSTVIQLESAGGEAERGTATALSPTQQKRLM